MGSRRWRRNQRLKCNCPGWWFPHRRGSLSSGPMLSAGHPGCLLGAKSTTSQSGKSESSGLQICGPQMPWWWNGVPPQPTQPGHVPF